MLDDVLVAYDEAWNTTDAARRANLLERSLADGAELVEPNGQFRGRDGIDARIAGFGVRFPGARVSVTSGVDEHNGWARYAWNITAAGGEEILRGIDVVQRAGDGRLARIVMFFGDLPPAG